MLHVLRNLFRRPAVRFGLAQDRRGRLRDPRFVSFIAQNNRKVLDTEFQDTVLRGRKLMKKALVLGLALGGAWIVVESAKALSVF